MSVIILGFITTFSLIAAIGAQNIHVLNTSIKKQNWIIVIITCFLCDLVLLNIGVWGLGGVVASKAVFKNTITILGCLFLSWYAFNSFKAVFIEQNIDLDDTTTNIKNSHLISTTLMLTLLNPHVYIDTIFLIGGISSNLSNSGDKIRFLIGALSASLGWFLLLGIFSSIMAPIFRKPAAWKILNAFNGCFMLYIIYKLILFLS